MEGTFIVPRRYIGQRISLEAFCARLCYSIVRCKKRVGLRNGHEQEVQDKESTT